VGDTLEQIVEELMATVGASRVTIRVDRPDAVFPVVAEALAPGVQSIAGPSSIDLRAAPTFKHLESTLGVLLQEDLLETDTPPPPELIARYGARAQMLAAVGIDGAMVGIVSVHHGPDPRRWADAEEQALRAAAARVEAVLRAECG
jgi:GAF domain-containing protein